MTTIKIQNKKIAEGYIIQGDNSVVGKKEKFLNSLITAKMRSEIKKIGFENELELKEFIKNFILGSNNKKIEINLFDEKKIMKAVKETLVVCKPIIASQKVKIFIFPTIDQFSIEKMKGINGFCVSKKTIFIGLFPVKNWYKELKKTLCHELAHALSPYYNMETMSVGDGLVLDGIAEHFRERKVGGTRAAWSTAIKKEKAKIIFKKVKKKLDSEKVNTYSEIFYGRGKYPLWAGYSIGYYLVGDYLKKINGKINWKRIIETSPKKILQDSGWM